MLFLQRSCLPVPTWQSLERHDAFVREHRETHMHLRGSLCVAWEVEWPIRVLPLQVADAETRPRHAAAAANADSSATHLTALVEAPVEAAPRRTYATNLLILTRVISSA
jgi:hypothetical protein